MTDTEKLREKLAKIIADEFLLPECRYSLGNQILQACKESGLKFTKTEKGTTDFGSPWVFVSICGEIEDE